MEKTLNFYWLALYRVTPVYNMILLLQLLSIERLFSCSNDVVFHHFVHLIKMSCDVVAFISLHLWFVVSMSLSTPLTCALRRNQVLLCWGVQWVFAYLWFGLFVCFCVFFWRVYLVKVIPEQEQYRPRGILWLTCYYDLTQYTFNNINSLCFKAFYIRCSLV